MSRVDRLELVVAKLAKRILGEDLTFDQIAEKEAAEQGVSYTPPASVAPAPEVSEIVAKVLENLAAAPAPSPPDVSPLLDAISHLANRVADLEGRPVNITMEPDPRVPDLEAKVATLARHLIEQEAAMQRLLQSASDLDRWVNFILDNGIGKDGVLRKAG